MQTHAELSRELEGKSKEELLEAAREYGPLAVKICLLANATNKKLMNPFWIGCPPGVFLSYKWNGPASKAYVEKIYDYISALGYRVYFDQKEMEENADTFTDVPEYISHVADCYYYVLILTEKTADFITARNKKTSWIYDEYEQAVSLANRGRMVQVPLLVEEAGVTDFYTKGNTINMVDDPENLRTLDAVFYPVNFKIAPEHKAILSDVLTAFDILMFNKNLDEAQDLLIRGIPFKNVPDFRFRSLILSLCTGDKEAAAASFDFLRGFLPVNQIPRLADCYRVQYGTNFSLLMNI